MIEDIRRMMELLPTLTKEEANFISQICEWDNSERSAFIIAKKLFEEKDDGYF